MVMSSAIWPVRYVKVRPVVARRRQCMSSASLTVHHVNDTAGGRDWRPPRCVVDMSATRLLSIYADLISLLHIAGEGGSGSEVPVSSETVKKSGTESGGPFRGNRFVSTAARRPGERPYGRR